jgi:site-specific DNA-cytosine methylase
MDYFSFFSGIGGFEVGIDNVFPKSNCLGYSEIEQNAMNVYDSHFPHHRRMGDIEKITKKQILSLLKNRRYPKKPLLIVGGFPCTNLTSIARINGDSRGLLGKESSLFFTLVELMSVLSSKTEIHFLLENNYSMSKQNRNNVTEILKHFFPTVFMVKIDSARLGVQRRRRLFWSDFYIDDPDNHGDSLVTQRWDDVLLPLDQICDDLLSDKMIRGSYNGVVRSSKSKKTLEARKTGNEGNRWKFHWVKSQYKSRFHSISDNGNSDEVAVESYPVGKARVYIGSPCHSCLVDRRQKSKDYKQSKTDKKIRTTFLVRHFNVIEAERLFFFPDGWVNDIDSVSKTQKRFLLGKSISVAAVAYALSCIK